MQNKPDYEYLWKLARAKVTLWRRYLMKNHPEIADKIFELQEGKSLDEIIENGNIDFESNWFKYVKEKEGNESN